MKKFYKSLAVIAVALLVALPTYAFIQRATLVNPNGESVYTTDESKVIIVDEEQGFGSAGTAYNSTSTAEGMVSGHIALKLSNANELGLITIASTSPTYLRIWNATSTTDLASTTIFTMQAEAAVGVYEFDIVLDRGLIIELPPLFNGNYLITYR